MEFKTDKQIQTENRLYKLELLSQETKKKLDYNFMVQKLKNIIKKEKIKSCKEMNKKLKNILAVTGSKQLIHMVKDQNGGSEKNENNKTQELSPRELELQELAIKEIQSTTNSFNDVDCPTPPSVSSYVSYFYLYCIFNLKLKWDSL